MISLQKGQAISLKKNDGGTLRRVAMGTGWDGVKKKGFLGFGGSSVDIDLDASALIYSKGRLVDQVWFRQLRSVDGNIVHSGDNRTGDGDGDDEVINVNLEGLGANVDAVVFTVNSFTGQTFSEVANAYTRVVDLDNGQEIARISLSDSGNHTGLIMAALKRTSSGWEFKAIGERAKGRTFHEMESLIASHI
jgi:tellurium resistance protein TerZ